MGIIPGNEASVIPTNTMPHHKPLRLLTTAQLAERLALSKPTLQDWRWKRTGPPFIRISRGCIRYDEDAVAAWVQAQTVLEIPRT